VDFVKDFGPEVLGYLERRRRDRREVFEMAFAVAATPEDKYGLAVAFLEATPDMGMQEILAAAAKKAGVAPS